MGDFPVPPTERLPIQIKGKLKDVDFSIFLLYNQLRNSTMPPYNKANGKSNMRNDLRNQLENIDLLRCNTKV